jgi:2-polyprenyl-6-methoxyphenol hydroxylase-like FAD-dependent oxidoreductase
LIIGGGPTGLACAIEASRAGLRYLVIEKGCLANSLYNYPTQMTFFTTPELLEIGESAVRLRAGEAEPDRGAQVLPARRRDLSAARSASTRG